MSASLSRLGWGLTLMVVILYVAIWLLAGGFLNYAKTVAVMAPGVMVILMGLRRHWHVMITAALAMDYIVLPLYGLNRLTPLFIMSTLSGLVLLMDVAREKRLGSLSTNWIDQVVFLMGIVLFARYFVNRAGFAALGMESGGFMNGVYVAAAPWFYMVARTVAYSGQYNRRQIWFVAIVALIANVLALYLAPADEEVFWARKLALSPAWMMAASMLALSVTAAPGVAKWVAYYGISGVMLGLGLISDYRSRTFFFLGQVGITSYFGACLKRTFVLMALAAVVLGGWIAVVRGGRVPEVMQRSMSIITGDSRTAHYARAGVMGWQDSTRAQLYELAWKEIRRNPIFGSGFGLSVNDALAILAAQGNTGVGALDLLAWSGGYHNSVVLVAAKAGVPVALMFSVVSIVLVWRFWRMVARSQDRDLRVWAYTILGFWWANTGMLLLNGGPREFLTAMVVNGLFAGMLSRRATVATVAERAPKICAQYVGS